MVWAGRLTRVEGKVRVTGRWVGRFVRKTLPQEGDRVALSKEVCLVEAPSDESRDRYLVGNIVGCVLSYWRVMHGFSSSYIQRPKIKGNSVVLKCMLFFLSRPLKLLFFYPCPWLLL